MPPGRPERRVLITAGVWLLAVGTTTYFGLSRQTDNVYLWLGILVLLAPIGFLFVIAGLSPSTVGAWLWVVGTAILWLVGGLGLGLFAFGLAIIPSQGYSTFTPLVAYLLGLVVLIATLYLIGWRLVRLRT